MPIGVYKHKSPSEETRRKMSLAKKGKVPKNFLEFIEKGHIACRGKPSWNKGTKGICKPNSGSFKKGTQGVEAPSWKGGRTPLIKLLRSTDKYKFWRSKIFERDNWTCQTCGNRGYVEAHHRIEFAYLVHKNKIKTINEGIKCEELWDCDNGVTLCRECHDLTKINWYTGFAKENK